MARRTSSTSPEEYWAMIHAERRRLLGLLDQLDESEWNTTSLCGEWSTRHVVAHLTAGARTGTFAWMRSMLFAGFNPERHNDRRLREYLGTSPAETLENFRWAIDTKVAPADAYAAMLGENIVHSQDIAVPLSKTIKPDPEALLKVARFFARKDFAVNSKSQVAGLRLEATDADFRSGSGSILRGPLLALVMVMAGRGIFLEQLEGDGVAHLSG